MVYKWCVMPKCMNTCINSPQTLFVSVPTDCERRKKWLLSARRDPKGISSTSNVFMCEYHFDMEKDTINYMQYKMGFSKKILLTEDAVPTKFHCQEDRKRPLSDAGLSRGAYVKRKRMDLVNTCLQSQNATEAQAESLQKDESLIQDIIEPQGLSRTQDRETITNSIITAEKSVHVTIKESVHHRSKSVQTRCQTSSISTSPMKVSTSRSTSPFKIKPCSLRPSQSEIVKVKRNVFLEDEKSDSDISCIESGRHLSPFVTKSASSSSGLTDSDSNVTDANENIEKLECLKITMRSISKKPMMYVGIPKECYFLIKLLHKHTSIKVEHILLCLKKIRMNSTFSELEDNFGIIIASKLFLQNIPIIASVLRPFIVK
ncbi:unnamed protein product [Acanthoscelides obtectus]|uniref:THAP-type domain-containing protein n=2 Tax=Acanthoscelides obtectus TaxID=200917 RepID=A0A9P0KIH4_ACAOB|nr:unnamed protein product [Acanthoscelides obtectus]CAK1664843.1 hypothetical protein AOBTE_LOCUS24503 [Acanthoscelides obtectus]